MYHLCIFLVMLLFRHGICSLKLDVCSAFMDSNPRLLNISHIPQLTKFYLSLEFVQRSEDYDLNIEFQLQPLPVELQDNTTTICLSLQGAEVRTELNNTLQVLLKVKTNENIPVGVLYINTSCWLQRGDFIPCKSAFMLTSDLMQTPMFLHSPLSEAFWTSLRDEDIFNSSWIWSITLDTYEGSIPSSWVPHLSLSSLRELYVTGNTWARPERLLGPLPNLEKLLLMNNSIEILPNDTFKNLQRVESVHLQINDLKRLPYDMSNVKIIDLSRQTGNTGLTISDSEIPSLRNMEIIHINTRVNANISLVLKLPNLKILSCRGCWVTEISDDSESLEKVENVNNINLASNNLTSLPPNIFKRLIKLSSLTLDSNLFEVCPCNALSTLSNLRQLTLSRNKIRHLPSHCFSGLHSLFKLDLSWNAISLIDSTTFLNASKLLYLYLSHNNLSNIHISAFLPLKSLAYLYISYNQLVEAPTLGNNLLNVVDLSHNLLTSITNLTMAVRYIGYIDLSNNYISELEFGKVRKMNLSYNSISSIPEHTWIYFRNLTQLDLGGNEFNCCHKNISSLQENINASNKIIRNLNRNDPLRCVPVAGAASVLLETFVNNGTVCSVKSFSLVVEIGVPLGVLFICVVLFVVVRRYYQFQFNYISYFLKMKRRGLLQDEAKFSACVYDAFVCYSGKNFRWITEQLLPNLETGPDRYRFCLHDRDFTLGAAIDKNIIESLKKSRKVIFVLSKEFLTSTWCQWELNMANHKTFKEDRNYIILIELERLKHDNLPTHLEYLMDSRTYLEWPQDPEDERRIQRCWQRLRHALGDSVLKRTGKKPPKGTVLEG